MESSEHSNRSRYGIDKLTGDNYYNWAWDCKLLLQEHKVWDVVSGATPDPNAATAKGKAPETSAEAEKRPESEVAAWNDKNETALRIISFTITERLKGVVRMCKSAKNAWDELEKVHASKNKQRKFNLLRRLYDLRMAPGSSLTDHEREYDGLIEGLAAMGRVIEPEDLVVIYANSLPKDYDTWLQGQSATLDKMDLSDFKGLVREETLRMINFTDGENSGASNANIANKGKNKDSKKKDSKGNPKTKKKQGNCHRCGEPGHFAKDCRAKIEDKDNDDGKHKRDGNSKGEKANGFGGLAYCYMAAADPNIRRDTSLWVLDSGASDFMHPDRNQFINYRALRIPRHINGIGPNGVKAVGIGSLRTTVCTKVRLDRSSTFLC